MFGLFVVVMSDSKDDREWNEETSLPSNSSSWDDSSSNDNELLGKLDNDSKLILEVVLAANQTQEFFNANKLDEGDHASSKLAINI